MAGRLYIGTSGFAYKEWKGPFYPDDLAQARFLEHYASRFPSVEINYTFRRYPSEATLRKWAGQTPEGFRFALKANQRITHSLRLRDADEAVGRFLEVAKTLGERLGPILYQCPPTLAYDRDLIQGFLGYLPPTFPAAFEFRHPSWEEAKGLIAEQGAAWCDAETDERAVDAISPGPFAYLRLRKDAYGPGALEAWAERIGAALAEGRDVYAFIKHETDAAAPGYAERLAGLVAGD
jgi:uncharacterized protein YecE (DUF72 family)